MLSTTLPAVLVVDTDLQPFELLSRWRPTDRTLALALRQRVERRQRLHVRISLVGLGVSATITGRARTIHRHAEGVEVDLEPDQARVRALEWLVEVANGAQVSYQPRPPRYHAALPAVVTGMTGPVFMNTLTVSEHGCGLAWTGPTPELDVPLEVRIGAGRRVASFCAEVCWTSQTRGIPTVGLRFAAGDRNTWAKILEELERTSPPA